MSRIVGTMRVFQDDPGRSDIPRIPDAPVNHHIEYYRAVMEAVRISAAKNHDYASDDDPLGNFRKVEEYGIPAYTGLLCRMIDKISRIQTFFTKGELKVEGEGLEDALMDLGNYCFLMIALLRDQQREAYMDEQSETGLRMDITTYGHGGVMK